MEDTRKILKLHGWITQGYEKQGLTEFGKYEWRYEKRFMDIDEENKRMRKDV
jgi:hypothetical protein